MSQTPPGPFFSVIIPTYNRAEKVVRAIQSVLAQTWTDFEVVVIDDGSTDETSSALEQFQGQIRSIHTANGGAASARNTGVAQAGGQYIAFLDNDDRWLPEMLHRAALTARAHPDAGLLYTGAHYVDENSQTLWSVEPKPTHPHAYQALLRTDFIITSGAVVRKDCLRQVGTFDPLLAPCEDWDLWIRIARQYPIQPIPGIWVLYEYAAQNKATSNYQRWINSHDRVIEKAFAADPALTRQDQRAIRAATSYIKGRICLEANADVEARSWFQKTLAQSPTHWKAWIYSLILQFPFLRARLPRKVKTSLRLPEALPSQRGAK